MLDPNEERIAFNTLRRYIDSSGYGYMVSDILVNNAATAVVEAVEQYRAGIAVTKPATKPATKPVTVLDDKI